MIYEQNENENTNKETGIYKKSQKEIFWSCTAVQLLN